MRDLTRGPLSGHLIAMAIPIAVGMLVQTLYYLVDLYFVSRLGGTALAGVSAAGNVFFLGLALTQSLSVGTIALVSHAVGGRDQAEANLVFNQAVFAALVLAAFVLLGGYLGLAELYIRTIAADEGTVAAGLDYLRWFLPAMAFSFGTTAMGAALQGTGIVKPNMIVQMIAVVANTILTPILITGWGFGVPLGVVGAALASSTAALLGLSLMTLYYVKLERYVAIEPSLWRPNLSVLKRMFAVGLPSGGEFALMFVYMGVVYTVIRPFGASAQAGFGAGGRVMQSVFLPAMSVAFAVPAIAGQNFGARDPARVRDTFRIAALMSSAIMVLITALCKWRPALLVTPFASDPEVLVVASVFLSIISWNFVPTAIVFTCSGMFQGMGNTLPSLASTATRIVTFLAPVLWLSAQPGFRIEQVWYASATAVTLQALLSLGLVRWQLGKRLAFGRDPEPRVQNAGTW